MRRRLSLNRHPSTAARLPEFLQRSGIWAKISAFSSRHLNFYRVHLLVFTLVPLVVSAIFWASNGPSEENQIAYIDALFMVTSAMTVTGLNSVEFQRITLWQQVILFIMMSIGAPSFVSIVVILIRRQFFRNKFEYMITHDAAARKRINEIGAEEAARAGRSYQAFDDQHQPGPNPWLSGLLRGGTPVTPRPSPAASNFPTQDDSDREKRNGAQGKKKKKKPEKLRADMIKRVDVPVRINEMSVSGRLGEGRREPTAEESQPDTPVRQHTRQASGQSRQSDDIMRGVSAALENLAATEGQDAPQRLASDRASEVFEDDHDAVSVVRHEGQLADSPQVATPQATEAEPPGGPLGHTRTIQIDDSSRPPARAFRGRRSSDSAATSPHRGPSSGLGLPRIRTMGDHRTLQGIVETPSTVATPTSPTAPTHNVDMGRTRTIEFRENDRPDLRLRRNRTLALDPDYPVPRRMSQSNLRDASGRTMTRTATIEQSAMHTGFGGFPNPLVAVADIARSKIPALRPERTLQRTTTMLSRHSHTDDEISGGIQHAGTGAVKPVSYISFDAIVGRNSKFHGLSVAQQEELGGVEYRALTVLLRIVPAYWLFIQLIGVLCIAPWLTHSSRWRPIIEDEYEVVNATWFSFFQVWSAFSNNGMSTVDASMVPFQQAYGLIIVMGFLILAGNTAFPIFLRLVIWTLSKCVPRRSRLRETLQFLLDHPRRCFIYLFPSYQTWFLVFVLICLNGIDWAAFLILDIGNPVIEAIPVHTRVIDGLLQSFAVRAAGFSIVPLSSVAPALQLLYVIMMYIAVYPIALSIRATNVYEEKSMGVYDEDFDDNPDDVEAQFAQSHSTKQYISYHARKQLAFDLWWLGLAVWLICIVERGRLGSTEWPEVEIFTLIFEITSAYGTVGLSLGNNRNNTSLSGVLSTLSKLIVVIVMVRGRHRGLPIAIDRAVLLPSDLAKHGDDTATVISADHAATDHSLNRRPTRGSFSSHPERSNGHAAGGLETVEPLTDEARVERARQASIQIDEGENGIALQQLQDDSSKDPSSESGDGATSSSDSLAKQQAAEPQVVPHDRDTPGWR